MLEELIILYKWCKAATRIRLERGKYKCLEVYNYHGEYVKLSNKTDEFMRDKFNEYFWIPTSSIDEKPYESTEVSTLEFLSRLDVIIRTIQIDEVLESL